MLTLLQQIDSRPNSASVAIIDADDLLEDPLGVMQAFSKAVQLPFHEGMLSWKAGPVAELASPFTGWTEDVQNSTGLQKRPMRSPPPSVLTLPNEVQQTITLAMAVYKIMSVRRVLADGALPTAHESVSSSDTTKGGGASMGVISITGTIIILASSVLWVGYAEILQRAHRDTWDKPYCQALVLKGAWSITALIWLAARRYQRAYGFAGEITFRKPLKVTKRTVLLSLVLMVFVQVASVTFISSLSLTSVSANTAIYQTNPLLVYVFSLLILQEKASYPKFAAVLLAMGGVGLVITGRQSSLHWIEGESSSMYGYILVTISTTVFSLKEVLFKRFFPSLALSPTPITDAMLCVGIIGVGSIIFLFPTLWMLDFPLRGGPISKIRGLPSWGSNAAGARRAGGVVVVVRGGRWPSCGRKRCVRHSPTSGLEVERPVHVGGRVRQRGRHPREVAEHA